MTNRKKIYLVQKYYIKLFLRRISEDQGHRTEDHYLEMGQVMEGL